MTRKDYYGIINILQDTLVTRHRVEVSVEYMFLGDEGLEHSNNNNNLALPL